MDFHGRITRKNKPAAMSLQASSGLLQTQVLTVIHVHVSFNFLCDRLPIFRWQLAITLPGWPPKPPPLPVIVEVDEPVPEAAPVAVDAGDIKSKMTGAIAGMATVRKTKPTEKAPPKVDLPKVRQKEPFLKKKKTIFYLSGSTTCCRC